jgi:hypothetical protein
MADRRCHVAAGFGGKTDVSIYQSADIRRRRRRAMRAKKKTSPLSSIPWNLPLFYPPMGQPSALPPTAREGGFPRAGLAYFPFDLSQAERMNMSGFSAAAGVENANSTRAAERLTSLGHVIKTPDEQDGRACRISLTASGRKVAERVVATGPQWGKLTAAGVCPSDRIPVKRVFD